MEASFTMIAPGTDGICPWLTLDIEGICKHKTKRGVSLAMIVVA